MRTNKLVALIATFVASFGALFFMAAPHAFAATRTWVGTDCPATNCNWSNVNNWSGGVAPVNGDSIVINSDTVTPAKFQATTDDIAALSVASITTSGYSNSSQGPYSMTINTTQSLTITGNVTHTVTATAAPSGWNIASFLALGDAVHPIVLGGNVTTQNVALIASTITLGGNTLNYNLDPTYTDTTFSLEAQLTGAGTFNIDLPTNVALFLDDTNNYSGTTNINSVNYVSALGDSTKVFGTSAVNLSSTARILFKPIASGAVTINNAISVTPPTVTGTFLNNQLEFWSETGGSSFTIPNITLLGNARFGTNDLAGAVSVNLAGITANGHCIQYGDGNSDVANFSNGPAACVVAVAAGKKAPNTGFASVSSNPIAVLAVSFASAGAIYYIARRSAKSTSKKH
ncbi:MAG: hypothetical protein ABI354_01575 [Candidatus Saccharimonadales bacterium]